MAGQNKKRRPELIEDQEIGSDANPASDAEIQFGLNEFVGEIENLIVSVATKTNIAVFAPWGSGKSSIANLLRARFAEPKRKKQFVFARADAFKFAEGSLSRYFITQVADELGLSEKKKKRLREKLYENEQKKRFRATKGTVLRIFLSAVAITAFLAISTLLLALVVSWLSKPNFGDSLDKIAGEMLLGWAPAVALLTVLVNIGMFRFGVTTDVSAPSGKEQFEQTFSKLLSNIDESKTVVIYIDELDRCSPKEVVVTLETLKTFLNSERCVFVVAADRSALEMAIQEEVRQKTPIDTADPYFTAASSYLDKIFQFQVALTPIKPHALTVFASDLVSKRDGIWKDMSDEARNDVVSVLLPTHVINPRRAKVLLNSFVLNYRIAKAAWDNPKNKLEGSPQDRVLEIAKLSTLKLEFPKFYDDLIRFDDLIPATLAVNGIGSDSPKNESLQKIVRRYERDAHKAGHVAALLPDNSRDQAGQDEALEDAAKEHLNQLINYLTKTASVPDPRSDLMYLEPVASGFEIPDSLAVALERAARDNSVLPEIAEDDDHTQQEALRFMAMLIARSRRLVGLELGNAILALLALADEIEDIKEATANYVVPRLIEQKPKVLDLVKAETKENRGERISLPHASGALRLVRAATRPERAQLLKIASICDESYDPPALGELISLWDDLDERTKKASADAVASEISLSSDGGIEDPLGGLKSEIDTMPDEGAATLTRLSIQAALELEPQSEEGVEPTDEQVAEFEKRILEGFIDSHLNAERVALANRAVADSLELAPKRASLPAVFDRLERLTPISDLALAKSVIDNFPAADPENWPAWVASIDKGSAKSSPELTSSIEASVRAMLETATDDGSDVDSAAFDETLAELDARLPDDYSSEQASPLAQLIDKRLADVPTDDAMLETRSKLLRYANQASKTRFLPEESLADAVVNSVAASLEGEENVSGTPFILRSSDAGLAEYGNRASEESLKRTNAAFENCGWISYNDQYLGELLCSKANRDAGRAVTDSLSDETLRGVATEQAQDWSRIIGLWIASHEPTPASLWQVLEPVAGEPLPDEIESALLGQSGSFSARERFELVHKAIEGMLDSPVNESFFRAAKIGDATPELTAKEIVKIVKGSSDPEQFRIALRLWSWMAPADENAWVILIDGVLSPLLDLEGPGVDVALQEFETLKHAPKAQREVIAAALHETGNDAQRSIASQLVEDAGWKQSGRFWKKLFGSDDDD